MPAANPEASVGRQLRSLVRRVIRPPKSDAALLATVQALDRRVGVLEFSVRQQTERAERLELLGQDLVAAIEALRQRIAAGPSTEDRVPETEVPDA
ncbi:MAG: hypothetical protein ACRDNK_07300 [Solirubrobacteraceae bacterium]